MTRKEISQHDAFKHIREAETYYLNLPGLDPVRLPTPANLAYYGGLALLVAITYIGWPLVAHLGIQWPTAVFLALGHALASRADRTSKETTAAIEQLRTEVRRLDENAAEERRRRLGPEERGGGPINYLDAARAIWFLRVHSRSAVRPQ